MSLEYCMICDEPTGNAGRLDDSIICDECGQTICEDCIGGTDPQDDYAKICKECWDE